MGAVAWSALGWGALLAVGVLAYQLGRIRARADLLAPLQQAREARRATESLLQGYAWQAQRGEPPQLLAREGRSLDASRLFALPAFRQALATRKRFDALRLRLTEPLAGHELWRVSGVPLHGPDGDYNGHAGVAQPCDDDERERLAFAALGPMLARWPGAALLALRLDGQWQVEASNAPARALVRPGQDARPLASALAAWPQVQARCEQGFDGGGAAQLQGWTLQPLALPEGHAPALLLLRLDDAAAAGGGDIDSLSFTLTHDLRQPLRSVDGFSRILKEDDGPQLDRVANDHLDRVLAAAARMQGMIDAMLGLARLSEQPLARQPVNLSQLAGYVIDELRRSAPERVVQVDVEPNLRALGDPTLLRVVLENLLGNAWKYTARCNPARIAMRAVPHGELMAFAVSDNGAGFDMASAERLFGLFQRLHASSEFPGHGVGLASVRRIVRRHGGEIWAEAEPGRGATFTFTLGR